MKGKLGSSGNEAKSRTVGEISILKLAVRNDQCKRLKMFNSLRFEPHL